MRIHTEIDDTVRAPFRVLGACILGVVALIFLQTSLEHFRLDAEVTAICAPGKGQFLCEIGRWILGFLPAHLHHPFLGLGAAAFALTLAAMAWLLVRPLFADSDKVQTGNE
uniref:hypothetical protein n=1 Tax=Hylemonella sp. TaxID=2066020 RepID=UPI0035B0BE62